jgi:hypothetical protein
MRRKIFLLGVMSFIATMMFAQEWIAPAITSADYAEVKMSSTAVGDTTYYYLYNIEGKGFMTNGRADNHTGQTWNTHAVLSSTGHRLFMGKYVIDGAEWDGKSVYIINWHDSKWQKVFAVHERNMFVDYADQTDAYPVWEMEKEDGNIYKFKVSPNNPAPFTEAMAELKNVSYMGFDIYDDDYVQDNRKALTPMIDVLSDEAIKDACITWAFIPEAKYDAYQTAVANYNSAVKLGDYIASVKENYPAVSVAAAEAVYNNTNSTAEQLDAANKQLQEDVYNYRIGTELVGATNSDPKDATSFMTNPDFESGNADGWTVDIGSTSASGYQGDSYQNGEVAISNFIQAWRPTYNVDTNKLGDGKMYTIVKNMPAGKYKIACDAIAVFQKAGAPAVTGVFMYVKSGSKENRREVATEDQLPQHFEITFAANEQSDIELGFLTESTSASWIAADNFKLTYYGEVTDPNQPVLEGLVEQYEGEYPDLDDVFANSDVKDAFAEEMDKSKNTAEGFEEQITALKAAYNALVASVKDYEKLSTAIADVEGYQEALEGSFPELAQSLADDLMEMQSRYEGGTADTEYCENIGSDIYNKVAQYIADNEKQGDEVTALIFNPDFDKGNVGWTWDPKNAADVKAMNTGNPVITAYHTTYDCYQTITGLKPGIYKLTVQGYYRTASESTAYEEYVAGNVGDICAEVYLNNFSAPLLNAFDDYYDQELSSGSYQFEEGKWAPASSADIAKAFGDKKELYLNIIYGYVLDDGKLTFGVREPSAPRDACYSTFDNFHLYYAGVDPEAVAVVTNKLQEAADELDGVIMSQEARNNMDAAISAVKAAGEDNIMACIGNFFNTIEEAKASAKLHEEIDATIEMLNTAILENEATASADRIAEAQKMMADLEAVQTTGCQTDAECQALITAAGRVVTAFKLPEGVASEENPIDYSCVLINPDLDQDTGNSDKNVPGWDRGSCNGYKQNTFSSFGSASHLYQTVVGLPAGKYVIEAQGAYRAGDPAGDASRYEADPEGDKNAWVFGTTSEGTVIGYLHRNTEYALEQSLASSGANSITYNGQTLYAPYNTGAYVAWFEAGYYKTSIEVIVPEDGKLTLGIDKPNYVTNDYMNINYVHLIYYGPVVPEGINDLSVKGAAAQGIYNLAGQKLATPQKGMNIIDGKKIFVK